MIKLYRKEVFYFRIVGMRKELLNNLKTHIVGHTVKTSNYQDTDTLVCSLEIMSNYDYSGLAYFLNFNSIPCESYGIYVSLVTERDNDGVHLPDYALQFYKTIGGNIDFSFVCTGGIDTNRNLKNS